MTANTAKLSALRSAFARAHHLGVMDQTPIHDICKGLGIDRPTVLDYDNGTTVTWFTDDHRHICVFLARDEVVEDAKMLLAKAAGVEVARKRKLEHTPADETMAAFYREIAKAPGDDVA